MPFSTRYPDLLLHLQLYCGRLETLNLDRAKTSGFDDCKRVNIANIDPFTIVESRELSRRSKSKFQADRSITSLEKKAISSDLQEALTWKSTLALDQIQALYVYGIGLGHYASVIQDWLSKDASRHLIFLEDDLSALEAFSQMPNAHEITNHPQIHLRWAPSPKAWDLLLEDCAAEFPFDKIEVSALKAYEKLACYQKIKLSLLRKTVLWNALTTETILSHRLHENIIPNLRRIPQCSYVNQWKEKLKGIPIIICGAGPSLQTVAEDLRNVRDRALIIACGSALSALAHLKIRPHLGIAIDPNSREFNCLSGCTYRDLPLLFGSRLYPKVFELFDGPYGYIRSGTGGPLESYVEKELGLNDPYLGHDLGREALSVTTLALSLAQSWGCNPIIFAGVDMAYARKKHYADGVPVTAKLNKAEKRSSDQMVYRKGAEGHFVPTLIKWIMERETIDRFAKNHPATTFFSATHGGLGFKQIPYKPLEEIIKNSSSDYDKKIRHLMQETKTQSSLSDVNQILSKLASSLERCLKLFQLLQQEEPESGKAVLYQTDLETEIAYELVLGSSKRALDRIGSKKDPLASEQDKWKFLEEAARSYLSSLK